MSEFDDIRPYEDDEVHPVIQGLLEDRDFLDFLGKYHSPKISKLFPGLLRFATRRVLSKMLGGVASVVAFQEVISGYAKRIVEETTSSFDYLGIDQLDASKAYLFVGNHRDIAGDSMLIDYALWLSGHQTVRIAVGDNLIQRDFATALMKLNKSFFIKRSQEGAKKIFAALLQSSSYIHHSIAAGHSIWIAQAEGRAKDGLDVTDPAIIKMFALARRKQPLGQTVSELGIVPVSISYEFDPCDYLKAKELSAIARHGSYQKPAGEDLLSLVKGLGEFKGKIVLHFGTPLEGDFQSAEEIANAIDRQILDNYQLYAINYWALRQLANLPSAETKYRDTWRALRQSIELQDTLAYEQRFESCPVDWRIKWLEMYANPVVNKYLSKSSQLQPI